MAYENRRGETVNPVWVRQLIRKGEDAPVYQLIRFGEVLGETTDRVVAVKMKELANEGLVLPAKLKGEGAGILTRWTDTNIVRRNQKGKAK